MIGWVDGTGTARNGVGSLLVGAHDDTGDARYRNLRNSDQLSMLARRRQCSFLSSGDG
ncbi:hypothetical protein Rrhod_3960 [Rhodococcus rhodnii LMG 5362]|uniref:Uncharacterized protein n=1 Tax=Rhodococcus rhodnii LMG 5362 TaxID=1273125 RepID=R7WHV0_9NOCA|nr:hypothetical protein Rrhod_3960 [Rhodococcus rhodnii LMG 5362]